MAKKTTLASMRKALLGQLAQYERGIKHHQQGIAYNERCMQQVHEALQALESMAEADAASQASGRRTAGLKAPRGATRKLSTKTESSKAHATRRNRGPASSDVPRTSNAFWLKHLRANGRTLDQILAGAVKALSKEGFVAGQEHLKVLRGRAAAALHVLVKQSVVKDEGSGRDRTYRLP